MSETTAEIIVYAMLAGMGGCILYLCIALPKRMAEAAKAREEALARALKRAVEIAQYQQWVSPHRLINQAHMTKSRAQHILQTACAHGLLYQAVNGRYYSNNVKP